MRQNYTEEQRNEIVESYLWCIDSVINQNYVLMKAARLDRDDVYQALAVRLMRAVERYDPSKASLKHHIFVQLHFELLSCNSAQARYGLKGAPYGLRGTVISMDALAEQNPYWESRIAA